MTTPLTPPDPDRIDPEAEPITARPPTLSETFALAAQKAGIGQVTPGETPNASSLLKAIGGVRGLIESILPGLGFLVIYTITQQLAPSVIAPLVIAVIFIVVRIIGKSPVMPAVAGFIGVGISALLALITGKPEDNFVPGLIINTVSVLVLLGSLIARWPLIGLIAGTLTGDLTGWRSDHAKVKVVTVATWCWVGLFAARLAVQAPLYFSGQTQWLASTKLLMGVPLYAMVLWVTWLLCRAAFGHERQRPVEPS